MVSIITNLIKPHKNKRDELILEDDIQNVVKEIWRQSKEELVDLRRGTLRKDKVRNETNNQT